MSLAIPLGLLGLTGILALIIIYIIKPNFQQKLVSSTYIWIRSLKFRKKRVPFSKLRNIILFICQLLVITACAMILSKPYVPATFDSSHEKIAVIDASANMRAEVGGETRFERAISLVSELVDSTLKYDDGMVTVIVASDNPYFLVQRYGEEQKSEIKNALNGLLDMDGTGELACSYASADLDYAFELSEQILAANPTAQLLYYTGTEHYSKRGVTLVSVAEKELERNIALLDARAIYQENKYSFEVDVASYGKDSSVNVYCDVTLQGSRKVHLFYPGINCIAEETTTITILPEEHGEQVGESVSVYTYEQVHIYVDVTSDEDCLSYDNELYLYGGTPPTLRVQYVSTNINPFTPATISALRSAMGQRWSFEVVNCTEKPNGQWSTEPEFSGFDMYIFEDYVPEAALPDDGIVFLLNPDKEPEDSSFKIGNERFVNKNSTLVSGEYHPIAEGITAGNITVSKYRRVELFDGYTPLFYIQEDPVALVRNVENEKVVVIPFSVNFSLSINPDYQMIFFNAFRYFMPSTISNVKNETDFMFDINESAVLNARVDILKLSGPMWYEPQEISEFPYTVKLIKPGAYTAQQILISNEVCEERFFVKVSAIESNITRIEDSLPIPIMPDDIRFKDNDLVFYFTSALAVLLALEWFLYSREKI